jgi:SAM-dependent methyltransferase
VTQVAPENLQALEAWNGVLFDRFVQYRHLVVDGLCPHGDEALRRHPPREGDRVLDVGCGFGDSAQQLARIVGASGSVLGIDVAPRFIEVATEEARETGLDHLRFAVADLQSTSFHEPFDYAFSRFGTMFFALPVPALRNIANAIVTGGLLCMVVWRRKLDNPWLHVAERVVDRFVEEPDETDEPTCGPGPFSMAGADTVAEQLTIAGFADIGFERCDIPYRIGADVEEAVSYNMAIGPAGEAIRLAGAQAHRLRPQIESALRDALRPYQTAGGVVLGASTWIITAHRSRT